MCYLQCLWVRRGHRQDDAPPATMQPLLALCNVHSSRHGVVGDIGYTVAVTMTYTQQDANTLTLLRWRGTA